MDRPNATNQWYLFRVSSFGFLKLYPYFKGMNSRLAKVVNNSFLFLFNDKIVLEIASFQFILSFFLNNFRNSFSHPSILIFLLFLDLFCTER
jgi:hypothetical protein